MNTTTLCVFGCMLFCASMQLANSASTTNPSTTTKAPATSTTTKAPATSTTTKATATSTTNKAPATSTTTKATTTSTTTTAPTTPAPAPGSIGGVCNGTTTNCTVANTHCVSKLCVCKPNLVSEGGKCVAAADKSCNGSVTCVKNAACKANVCKCATGHLTSGSLCVPNCTTTPLFCSHNEQCNNVTRLCDCKTGYKRLLGVCTTIAKIDTACNKGNECNTGVQLTCETATHKCVCKGGYHKAGNTCAMNSGAAQMLISTMFILMTSSVAMIGT